MSFNYQQKDKPVFTYPKSVWSKAAFRAPLLLWRLGLGAIIGRLIVVITTTGWKSKQPRHNMAEYYRLDGKKYVVCGFGPRAAWYKNIQADPHVTIQTSDGIEPAEVVRVREDEELIRVYELFKAHNPLLTKWYLESLDIEPTHEDLLAKKDRTYWLRFDPTNEPTPPPLESDLKWVWLVILALLGVIALYASQLKKRSGK
ncbi:MAG TPA: nitroreductase family deazaflavin-dependent oxidoreductase [Chloroflexia bacterium]|nr:nitroreductase family deazaflavin-dependent oxidoreductase [Chloroflexia bacterium]